MGVNGVTIVSSLLQCVAPLPLQRRPPPHLAGPTGHTHAVEVPSVDADEEGAAGDDESTRQNRLAASSWLLSPPPAAAAAVAAQRQRSDPLRVALDVGRVVEDAWLVAELQAALPSLSDGGGVDASAPSSPSSAAAAVGSELKGHAPPPPLASLFTPLSLEAAGSSVEATATLLLPMLAEWLGAEAGLGDTILPLGSIHGNARGEMTATAAATISASAPPAALISLLSILLRNVGALRVARVHPAAAGLRHLAPPQSSAAVGVMEAVQHRLESSVLDGNADSPAQLLVQQLSAALLAQGAGVVFYTSSASISSGILRCCKSLTSPHQAIPPSPAAVRLTCRLLSASASALLTVDDSAPHTPEASHLPPPPSQQQQQQQQQQLFIGLAATLTAPATNTGSPLPARVVASIGVWMQMYQSSVLAAALACLGVSVATSSSSWAACDAPAARCDGGGRVLPTLLGEGIPSLLTQSVLSHASLLQKHAESKEDDGAAAAADVLYPLLMDTLAAMGVLCSSSVSFAAAALPWLQRHSSVILQRQRRRQQDGLQTLHLVPSPRPAPQILCNALQSETPAGNRDSFSGQVGTRFRVAATATRGVTVVSLGRAVSTAVNLGRLQRPHLLCLWRQRDQRLLATAVADNDCPRDALGYAVATLASPVVLSPGVTYCVTAVEVAGCGDPWFDPAAPSSTGAASSLSMSSSAAAAAPISTASTTAGADAAASSPSFDAASSLVSVVGDCWRETPSWLSSSASGGGSNATLMPETGGAADDDAVAASSAPFPSPAFARGVALEFPDRTSGRSRGMGGTTLYWRGEDPSGSTATASTSGAAASEDASLVVLLFDTLARACASLVAGAPLTELEERCAPWFHLPFFQTGREEPRDGCGSPFLALLRRQVGLEGGADAVTLAEYAGAAAAVPASRPPAENVLGSPRSDADADDRDAFLLSLILGGENGGGDAKAADFSPSVQLRLDYWLSVTEGTAPISSAASPLLEGVPPGGRKRLLGASEIAEAWLQARAPEPRLLQRKQKYGAAGAPFFAAMLKHAGCVQELRAAVEAVSKGGMAASPPSLSVELARVWARMKTFRKWLRAQASALRAADDARGVGTPLLSGAVEPLGDDSGEEEGEVGGDGRGAPPTGLTAAAAVGSSAAAAAATAAVAAGTAGAGAATSTAVAALVSRRQLQEQFQMALHRRLQRFRRHQWASSGAHSFEQLLVTVRSRCLFILAHAAAPTRVAAGPGSSVVVYPATLEAVRTLFLQPQQPLVPQQRQQHQQQLGRGDAALLPSQEDAAGEGGRGVHEPQGSSANADSAVTGRGMREEGLISDVGASVLLYARNGAPAAPPTLARCALRRRARAALRTAGLQAQATMMGQLLALDATDSLAGPIAAASSSAPTSAPLANTATGEVALLRGALRYLPAALRGRSFVDVQRACAVALAAADAASRAATTGSAALFAARTSATTPASASTGSAAVMEYALLDTGRGGAGDLEARGRLVRSLLAACSAATGTPATAATASLSGGTDPDAHRPDTCVPLSGFPALVMLPPALFASSSSSSPAAASPAAAAAVASCHSVQLINIDGSSSVPTSAAAAQWVHPLVGLEGVPGEAQARLNDAHRMVIRLSVGWLQQVASVAVASAAVSAGITSGSRGGGGGGDGLLALLIDVSRAVSRDYLPDDAVALQLLSPAAGSRLTSLVSDLLKAHVCHAAALSRIDVRSLCAARPTSSDASSAASLPQAWSVFASSLAAWPPDVVGRELAAGCLSKAAVVTALLHMGEGLIAACGGVGGGSSSCDDSGAGPSSGAWAQLEAWYNYHGLQGPTIAAVVSRHSVASLQRVYRRVYLLLRDPPPLDSSRTTEAVLRQSCAVVEASAAAATAVLAQSLRASTLAGVGKSIALHLSGMFLHAGLARRLRTTLQAHHRALVVAVAYGDGAAPPPLQPALQLPPQPLWVAEVSTARRRPAFQRQLARAPPQRV